MTEMLSDEYRAMLVKMHTKSPWGRTAEHYFETLAKYAGDETTWLDYGSGWGGLKIALEKWAPEKYNIIEYEPGKVELSGSPAPSNYVVCIDVLEHIEPTHLDAVLDDLKRVVLKTGYFKISSMASLTLLPNGKNAHLIQEPYNWWLEKLGTRFNILEEQHTQFGLRAYVGKLT